MSYGWFADLLQIGLKWDKDQGKSLSHNQGSYKIYKRI